MMNSIILSIAGSIIFSSRIMVMSALSEVGSETGYFPFEKCCVELQSMGLT